MAFNRLDEQQSITCTIDNAENLLILQYGGIPVMRLALSELAVVEPGPVSVTRVIAWDVIRRKPRRTTPMAVWRCLKISPTQDRIVLSPGGPGAGITIALTRLEPWHIAMDVRTDLPGAFVQLSWQTAADEHWRGFGEHSHTILPPAQFDSWVEEGPVGLGWLSSWLTFLPAVPFPKGPYPSYASLPLWLSSAGYSAWFESSEMIRWSLGHWRRKAQVWASQTRLHVIAGPDPATILARQFSVLGRPSVPPAWVFAPWNDSVHGQEQALLVARFLREQRIPSSAIWIEDWMGSHEDSRRFWMRPLTHRPDTALYPDFPRLASTLHAGGYRMLGYFCPELTEGSDLYRQADRDGVLVKNAAGRPVRISILGISHGQLDPTHPHAFTWMRDHLFQPALALGFDGWMADFGEYLPVSAQMADGTTGWQTHNRYPLLWQQAHRTFWEQARPSGDYTFFVRSGWVGTHAIAPVMWGGDSDTDFEEGDGLPTVVPQVLSAQTAGFFYWGTDIAGYMTFGLTRPSSRLLYWRWLQLAALLPVMRTHHGTARPRNWRFDKDGETLGLYARYARLHTALYPYFHHLAVLAADDGIPLIRPLYLEYPQDATCWSIDQQFMLGSSLLVAPVTQKQSKRHMIYFPAGSWRCWWTGTIHEGPQWMAADIPEDRLPLYLKQGCALPLFEGAAGPDGQMEGIVDSLAPIAQGPGVDLGQALNYLALYANCGQEDLGEEIALPSGGRLSWRHRPAAEHPAPGGTQDRPRHFAHLPAAAAGSCTAMLSPGDPVVMRTAGGLWELSLSADSTRPVTCTVRWWDESNNNKGGPPGGH